MKEIRTKNSAKNFVPTERSLAIYIPISTSFRSSPPQKGSSFHSMERTFNYATTNQRDFRLSSFCEADFFEEICGQFELIFRGKCVVNRGLLHPRSLFSAGNYVLFTYLNGFVKENSPRRWVSLKIEMNSRSDSWKKFRVILLFGVSSNATVGWNGIY